MPAEPISPDRQNPIVEATKAHQKQLEAFFNKNPPTHRHLDWFSPLDLLGRPPFLIRYKERIVQAVLCATPENRSVAWIRTFSVLNPSDLLSSWEDMLPIAIQSLRDQGIPHLAILELQPGLMPLLKPAGFEKKQSILILAWQETLPPKEAPMPNLRIRAMDLKDLETVARVDREAFHPRWQNSLEELTKAFYQTRVRTVALINDEIAGYQISTTARVHGHLARLAVRPACQRLGIASALVTDLLHQFKRRGYSRVTVNTQSDNQPSLALYEKFGFTRTKEEIPVHELAL